MVNGSGANRSEIEGLLAKGTQPTLCHQDALEVLDAESVLL